MSPCRAARLPSNANLGNRIKASAERLTVLRCAAPSKNCLGEPGRSSNCTSLRDTNIMRLPNSCNAPSETRNHSSTKRNGRCATFCFRRRESCDDPEPAMALQVSRNARTIRLNFQVRAEPSKTNRHLRVSFFKGSPVLTLRPLLLIDHCMPALRKTRRQPVSVFAARAMGSWCDQRKHGRQTLCRAATRSCSSLHRETCRVACRRV